MTSKPKPAIDWRLLPSHYARSRRLRQIWWARRFQPKPVDRRDLTVTLDGAWITDVPSFWLSLGEAINGRHGYFGSNFGALDDCLRCGGFGALPPLTIYLTHYNKVREALDCRAWIRFHADLVRDYLDDEYTLEELEFIGVDGYFRDGLQPEIAAWRSIYLAALNDQPFECRGYRPFFDVLLQVLADNGAILLPAQEAEHH